MGVEKTTSLTIEAHKRIFFGTASIIPTVWNNYTTLLISIIVIRLPTNPFVHFSLWFISKGPAPAIDIIIQSDPSTGAEI